MHDKIMSVCKALKLPIGYLLHDGYLVKCAGNVDSEGNRTDQHVVVTIGVHVGDAQAHAVGNDEFTDDCCIFAEGFDSQNPVCPIDQKELVP